MTLATAAPTSSPSWTALCSAAPSPACRWRAATSHSTCSSCSGGRAASGAHTAPRLAARQAGSHTVQRPASTPPRDHGLRACRDRGAAVPRDQSLEVAQRIKEQYCYVCSGAGCCFCAGAALSWALGMSRLRPWPRPLLAHVSRLAAAHPAAPCAPPFFRPCQRSGESGCRPRQVHAAIRGRQPHWHPLCCGRAAGALPGPRALLRTRHVPQQQRCGRGGGGRERRRRGAVSTGCQRLLAWPGRCASATARAGVATPGGIIATLLLFPRRLAHAAAAGD